MKILFTYLALILSVVASASAQITVAGLPTNNITPGVDGDWGHASVTVANGAGAILVVADPLYVDPAAPGSMGAVHFINETGLELGFLAAGVGATMAGTALGQCLVEMGDFNGDGVSEIAASIFGGAAPGSGFMLLIDPVAQAVVGAPLLLGAISPLGAASITDINGDGIRDFVVSDSQSIYQVASVASPAGLALIVATPFPTGPQPALNPANLGKQSIVAVDCDADGFDDVLVGDSNFDAVWILDGDPLAFGMSLSLIPGPGFGLGVSTGFGGALSLINNPVGLYPEVAVGAPLIDTVQIWNVPFVGGLVFTGLVSTWTNPVLGNQSGRSLATIASNNPFAGDYVAISTETPGAKNFFVIDQTATVQYSFPAFLGGASTEVHLHSTGDILTNGFGDLLICEPSPGVAAGTILAGAPTAAISARPFAVATTSFPNNVLPSLAGVLPPMSNAIAAPSPTFTATFGNPIGTAALFVGLPSPPIAVLPAQFIYLTIDPLLPSVPLGPAAALVAMAAYPFVALPILAGVTVTAQAYNTDGTFYEFTNALDLTLGY